MGEWVGEKRDRVEKEGDGGETREQEEKKGKKVENGKGRKGESPTRSTLDGEPSQQEAASR